MKIITLPLEYTDYHITEPLCSYHCKELYICMLSLSQHRKTSIHCDIYTTCTPYVFVYIYYKNGS